MYILGFNTPKLPFEIKIGHTITKDEIYSRNLLKIWGPQRKKKYQDLNM